MHCSSTEQAESAAGRQHRAKLTNIPMIPEPSVNIQGDSRDLSRSVMLRAATPEDSTAVAALLIASRKAFLPYAPIAHTDAEVHEWAREVLIPSQNVTLAYAGTALTGVLATSRECGVSWINQLYMAPGHAGQGIGTRLLEQGLQFLALPVRLYTFQANSRARVFYERHGFEAIAFTDGQANEERCPDVLYELAVRAPSAA